MKTHIQDSRDSLSLFDDLESVFSVPDQVVVLLRQLEVPHIQGLVLPQVNIQQLGTTVGEVFVALALFVNCEKSFF